jgi:4-azaleucine resistance transporter AzlC
MKFIKALKDTLPIFISYFTLSFSFGILAVKTGLNPYVAIFMSIFIYSGSLQFMLLAIYKKLSLIDIFITSFLLNFRQFFYSLTFLDRYKNHLYKIFALTDETFAILSHQKPDPQYELYVSVLNHLYWVIGTICGVIFVQKVNFEFKGLDFVLISLFAVILT